MKAILKLRHGEHDKLIERVQRTMEKHRAEQIQAWSAGHSDRAVGSGSFHVDGSNIVYCTGSFKGRYIFTSDSVIFEGRRNSFKDGTEYFIPMRMGILMNHISDNPKIIRGEWELLESSQPDRDLWD